MSLFSFTCFLFLETVFKRRTASAARQTALRAGPLPDFSWLTLSIVLKLNLRHRIGIKTNASGVLPSFFLKRIKIVNLC